MKVLLTGGAGYIGSHTAIALIEAGHRVIVIDNFANSSPEAIKRVEKITNTKILFYEADVNDNQAVNNVMQDNSIGCVIHFAGLKAVGESINKPIEYYRNNIDTTLTLLECMEKNNVKDFVFSSSATVYGQENIAPYTEDMPKGTCSNPYGWTKNMIERILLDAAVANPELNVVLLRYFNPIGVHESGLIGEDPQGIPNNLMPYISQVAIGRREKLEIFGNDYPTPDGTCRRDYIHVMDLAEGHVKAVEYLAQHKGTEIFNLGTGTPYSVLEIVHTFEKVNNVYVPFTFGSRRSGDLADCWANADKAYRELGWRAKRTLAEMCKDTWNWQKKNPIGYNG